MTTPPSLQEHARRLRTAGLDTPALTEWLADVARARPDESGDARELDARAGAIGKLIRRGWSMLDRLPLRGQRSQEQKAAGESLVKITTDLCRDFARTWREPIYGTLTGDFKRHVRVDDLVYAAAERWHGLVPTRVEVAKEAERAQADKDGLEIFQGGLIGQLLTSQRIGLHLINSMLRPTADALAKLEEFKKRGAIDLGAARIEVRGETGFVYAKQPQYLNAEDQESLGPQEVAVDLVLLHPGLKMGVLRGDVVDHPRYRGRHVFSAGLNLTKVYYGKLPYLFYDVRDLGLVNKLYRGLTVEDFDPEQPENTQEKPWMAVLEAFAIGGGCQLLLVMDYVIAEAGSYFNLPARKEGIIPGAANLRLPRFIGERQARAGIMFDKKFSVDSPEGAMIVNEVVPREEMDQAIDRIVANAVASGMVSAGANRKALRVLSEPLDAFRNYMALYAYEQALCHLSDQLIANLEFYWNAKQRRLAG